MNILFVCAGNAQRSPTFEKYFKKHYPRHDYRSAGTYTGYPYVVNREILEWADRVFVMDLDQAIFIFRNFPDLYEKIEVVGISDQYDPDDPKLIALIEFWFEQRDRKLFKEGEHEN